MLKLLLWIVGIAATLYLGAVFTLYFAQEAILFQEDKLDEGYQFEFQTEFEEINLKTKDGSMLNVIHFKAEKPKGIIVYFHGNAGDLSRWGLIAERFIPYGHDVLIVDYRGYGKSRGKRSSNQMYTDANVVYQHAKTLFDESQITVYGRSLGCTFASYAASQNKPLQLILETPFYNLRSIVFGRYPFLPSLGLLRFKFPTNEFIQEVKCPISFFHGTNDFVVPYESGKKLFDLTTNSKLITIFEGGHNDLGEYPQYWQEIETLLQ